MMKHSIPAWLIVLAAALAFTPAAVAVPAAPGPVVLLQPDGSAFDARQWGDELSNGWETLDGYTVVRDGATGRWTFAVHAEDGRLAASTLVVGTDTPPADWPRRVRPAGAARASVLEMRHLVARELETNAAAASGTANVPVILVNFADTSTTYGPSDFDSLLFGTGDWSMKDYYEEVSYGAFSVSAGPSGVAGWYTASKNHDYYGTNNDEGRDEWPGDLAYEAVSAADAAGFDFAPYDNDGDCYVDVVNIVHQGRGAESGGSTTDIWSHSWSLAAAKYFGRSHYGVYTTNDACAAGGYVMVNSYVMQPERSSTGTPTVGVFAHEFGHALGLRDLYDTGNDDGAASEGIGRWSLMAAGSWASVSKPGDRPAHLDAWSKVKLGWVTPTVVTGTLENQPIATASAAADVYQLRPGGPERGGEYFLVEHRERTGFDAGIPGRGLLIWHIDEGESDNDRECYPGGPDCTTQHYKVSLVQADGKWELEKDVNQGNGGDPFPGWGPVRTFDGATDPSSALFSGEASGVRVTDISDPDEAAMTATLSVGSTGGFTRTILEDGFEGDFPGPWTVTPADGSVGWGPSTYRAASGSASLWCAGGGTAAPGPGSDYPANMSTALTYGPFSLAGAGAATLEFDVWWGAETGWDYLRWQVSTDGENWEGYRGSGVEGGWEHMVFDLGEISEFQVLGAENVWVRLSFESDQSVEYEGVYVDNVRITATTPYRLRRRLSVAGD